MIDLQVQTLWHECSMFPLYRMRDSSLRVPFVVVAAGESWRRLQKGIEEDTVVDTGPPSSWRGAWDTKLALSCLVEEVLLAWLRQRQRTNVPSWW